VKRFKKIFKWSQNHQSIYIPGDNDIGGEGFEPVKKDKVKRFQHVFGDELSWQLGNDLLEIYNVNLITNKFPALRNNSETKNATRILISHFPVLSSYSSDRVIDYLNPSVIFSAHDHKSNEIVSDKTRHIFNFPFPLKHFKTFDIETLKKNGKILEISVPTCSYRMGTLTVGYSQAIFDDGKLLISPMFVTSRFYQLAFYVFFCILLMAVNFLFCKKKKLNVKYERLI
jgi:ethanolamine phosphate phosphodiesterase